MWPTAVEAASPASFQPSNAATMTGSTSSGTPSSSITQRLLPAGGGGAVPVPAAVPSRAAPSLRRARGHAVPQAVRYAVRSAAVAAEVDARGQAERAVALAATGRRHLGAAYGRGHRFGGGVLAHVGGVVSGPTDDRIGGVRVSGCRGAGVPGSPPGRTARVI